MILEFEYTTFENPFDKGKEQTETFDEGLKKPFGVKFFSRLELHTFRINKIQLTVILRRNFNAFLTVENWREKVAKENAEKNEK